MTLMIIIVLILTLMLKGFMSGTEDQPRDATAIGLPVIILWPMILYVVPHIKSLTSLPVLIPRNTILAIPAILYLASFGLSKIRQPSVKAFILCGLVLMSTANIIYEKEHYSKIKKQQYRDIITEVIAKYPGIPVYSFKNDKTFNIYSQLMGLPPRVQSVDALKRDLKNGTVDDCFILVEGHKWKLKKILKKEKFLKGYDFHRIKKVYKKAAQAMFFSLNDTPKSFCLDKKSVSGD